MEGATESPCIFFEMCNYHGKNKFHSSPKMLIPTLLTHVRMAELDRSFSDCRHARRGKQSSPKCNLLIFKLSKLMTLREFSQLLAYHHNTQLRTY